MLDDPNILKQRDSGGALEVAAKIYQQANFDCQLRDAEHDARELRNIIVAGMGGSALAADLAKSLLKEALTIPFDVIKDYNLPHYAGRDTLVIASSHSGNTEETLSCLEQAIERGCQIAIIATGGKVDEVAKKERILSALIPKDCQPRMAVVYSLRALLEVLNAFKLIDRTYIDELTAASTWLEKESSLWVKDVPTKQNYAKQLALIAVGKTPVFYGGSLMAPLAYKWKISWNENAKNVAFCNYLPEFSHNEFVGWTSHPIEKPFAVFDLLSDFEHPRILKRFSLTDRMLSGKRPKSTVVPLAGKTPLQQMLWGCVLADFASIYVAILNNVDPTQVNLIEKFKKALDK